MATEKKNSSSEEQPRAAADSGSGDSGAGQVQAAFDEANEKGYFGATPDDTPNEAYTLKGVASGQDTPESKRGE